MQRPTRPRLPTGLATRPATAADIPALFRIRIAVRENALSRTRLAAAGVTPRSVARLLADSGAAWIAEEDGRALGFAMADAAEGMVFALFVLPEHEGRGLGRALLRLAEAWLAARGWRRAWLLTGAARGLRAPGFYHRMGWRARGGAPRGERRFVRDLRARSREAEPAERVNRTLCQAATSMSDSS